jgi:hypothetical protein
MDDVRAGRLDGADLFAQARKVSGQYGRRHLDRCFHRAPQVLMEPQIDIDEN